MNETLVAPRHHSPSFVDRLCERIVLSAMQRMTRDRLEMTLPAGNQLSIGACNGEPARMKIRDAKFFQRCVLYGDVGFAESYIELHRAGDRVGDPQRRSAAGSAPWPPGCGLAEPPLLRKQDPTRPAAQQPAYEQAEHLGPL